MNDVYVFDSSTLILLSKTTLLRIFAKTNKIIVTTAVKTEVLKNRKLEDANLIMLLMDEGLIKESMEKIGNKSKFMKDFKIEAGEAESLCFALKNKYAIASDDKLAIKACKLLDVKFINAIHCLIKIYKSNMIDKRMAFEKLKNLEKFGRYSPKIMKDARFIVGGNQKWEKS